MRDLSFNRINEIIIEVLKKNNFKMPFEIEVKFELRNTDLAKDNCRVQIYQ
jgi:hypothetical protein